MPLSRFTCRFSTRCIFCTVTVTTAAPAVLQGLNVVVNQPFGSAGTSTLGNGLGAGRNIADPSGSARRPPSTGAGAGGIGAGAPPMVNEGRWTDNGQPLTAAEGRTVMPMLEQVEQAVVARLLPSQALDGGVAGAGAATAGSGVRNEEAKEEQVQCGVV